MAERNFLSVSGAEQILLELYDISAGRAKKLVKDAIKSDEVQKKPDFVYLTMDDGLVAFDDKVELPPGLVHKNDLLYWAKNQGLTRRRTQPSARGRRYAPASQVPQIVSQYLASAAKPSEDNLIRHVKEDLKLNIPREELRREYREQRGPLHAGRPSKKSAENNPPK